MTTGWNSLKKLAILIGLAMVVALALPGGVAATTPVALNTNAATDSGFDATPQVTTDGAGNWVAVWSSNEFLSFTIGTDPDILVARSTDNGTTWTPPTALNFTAAFDFGPDFNPQVTTDGLGNWVAVWDSTENLGGTIGTDEDILVARSTDNGTTWTFPTALNTNAADDLGADFHPQVTTDGAGNWVAVWVSNDTLGGTIDTDFDILYALSTDNGANWTLPAALNTFAANDSAFDIGPQVTTDGLGNWVAVWQSDENLFGIGPDADILLARSVNDGATWGTPAALNINAVGDTGGDFNPQVTTDGLGNWVAVWDSKENLGGAIGTDRDILTATATGNGGLWTAPTSLKNNAATDGGAGDFDPEVTTDGLGNWVAVWHSRDSLGGTIGTDDDNLFARSVNNGATWTDPAALNKNAVGDSAFDFRSQVTTDGSGNWVAVWQSDDSLGGTIGTDDDILLVGSTDKGATWTDINPPNDPFASSNSHVVGDPSGDHTIDMVWNPAIDEGAVASGVGGYSFEFNTINTPKCDETEDLSETATSVTSAELPDGRYFFHLCAVDNAGNWSSAVVVGPFIIVTASVPLGGIGSYPDSAGLPLEAPDSSGGSYGVLAGVFAAVTVGAVALGGAAWYARRRWLG